MKLIPTFTLKGSYAIGARSVTAALLALSLGVLGPNEREYLGDELKEVDVFHPETAL